MQVEGKSPDLNSSYFLDRAFWRNLLRQNREGIVVAVPKRGSLLFTSITDSKAVDGIRKGIAYLYSSSEHRCASEGWWAVTARRNSTGSTR